MCAMKVLAGYIEETGHMSIVVKSGQEPAIIKLKSAVEKKVVRA